MVSERAEKNKKINLKAGRYIRIESDTRLARVDEEYDLLRKFANYHYSSISTTDATVDDLSMDLLLEYLSASSKRKINDSLTKNDLAKTLGLVNKNDPYYSQVKNYAVLMFSPHPEHFIPYSYTELIIDMFNNKKTMESKTFKGPIWKQYSAIINYINDNYLNELVLREEGKSENRRIMNFPFTAVEELLANAIVHNNYENQKPIQIYISRSQLNIVNYNKPLPPLKINDLNERSFFNERDTENPELRDMFKALGIIESFGTGIGEAKRAMQENGSPQLYYKLFDSNDNVTSVVIPVNEEYYQIKYGNEQRQRPRPMIDTENIKQKILNSNYSQTVKRNLCKIYEELPSEVFGNERIVQVLNCSEVTATTYIKRMHDQLQIIAAVQGAGKGKYKFSQTKS